MRHKISLYDNVKSRFIKDKEKFDYQTKKINDFLDFLGENKFFWKIEKCYGYEVNTIFFITTFSKNVLTIYLYDFSNSQVCFFYQTSIISNKNINISFSKIGIKKLIGGIFVNEKKVANIIIQEKDKKIFLTKFKKLLKKEKNYF